MKVKIEVDLKPFDLPRFVEAKGKAVKTTDGEFIEKPRYRLQDLDANTLARLCENFTNNLFQQAGKQRPPTVCDCGS